MKFPQENKDAQYTLISIIMHDGYSRSSGHYYCEVFYFNTGKWWRYDDYTITNLMGLPDNL